jgi:hypothetical protein
MANQQFAVDDGFIGESSEGFDDGRIFGEKIVVVAGAKVDFTACT